MSDAQGMTMKDGEGHDYTWVTGDYAKAGDDNAKASIVIQDSAVANTPFKQQWGAFRSYESTEGSMKSVTVKGQPGWESYDKSSNNYGHDGLRRGPLHRLSRPSRMAPRPTSTPS